MNRLLPPRLPRPARVRLGAVVRAVRRVRVGSEPSTAPGLPPFAVVERADFAPPEHRTSEALLSHQRALAEADRQAALGRRPQGELEKASQALLNGMAAALQSGRPEVAVECLDEGYLSKSLCAGARGRELSRLLGALKACPLSPMDQAKVARAEAIAVHYRRGDWASAEATLRQALRQLWSPETERAFDKGRVPKFLESCLARPVAEQREVLESLTHLGRVLGNLGRHEEEARCYDLAQALISEQPMLPKDPATDRLIRTQAHLSLNLAGAQLTTSRPEAMRTLRENLVLTQGKSGCLEVRMQTLYQLGRLTAEGARDDAALREAEELFRRASQLTTDDYAGGICEQNWGLLCRKQGRLDEARTHLERAAQLFSNLGEAGRAGRDLTRSLLAELPVSPAAAQEDTGGLFGGEENWAANVGRKRRPRTDEATPAA
jgi:tetratricopeptide (TPR) repeat protein